MKRFLGAELLRSGSPNIAEAKKRQCTMQAATDYCRLPGQYGYKWPSLQELHTKLFGQPFEGAHNALVDVRACARCYFELKRLGVMA
jgi:DNA polymerase III epsilon subunit-like protein